MQADKITVSQTELDQLITRKIREVDNPPKPWEGRAPALALEALAKSHGDPTHATNLLAGWGSDDSDVCQALGVAWSFSTIRPASPHELEPAARRYVMEAFEAHGNKPWPKAPAKPEPTPPPTADDFAREFLAMAQRQHEEAAKTSRNNAPARVQLIPGPPGLPPQTVTLPEPSVEEVAAKMLMRECQQNSGIANVIFPGVQYHYLLGKDSDIQWCRALIDRVNKK